MGPFRRFAALVVAKQTMADELVELRTQNSHLQARNAGLVRQKQLLSAQVDRLLRKEHQREAAALGSYARAQAEPWQAPVADIRAITDA